MQSGKILTDAVAVLHRHVPPGARLVLGLSGGSDSVVLFHVLLQLQASHSFHLACAHVHHGLSPHADAWADFCRNLCAMHHIPLTVHRVHIARDDPAGIEAAARTGRHHIFAASEADFVLTAQHRDDQAETFLLQLLRGAGPKGLAAMAEMQHRCGWKAALLRPLLNVARADIRAYAEVHGLEWVEDESNLDRNYRRNDLRHTILPLVAGRFPGYAATLARAAALQADAAELLQDLAQLDAADAVTGERLDCAVLARLSQPRARNLLRYFIGRHVPILPHEEIAMPPEGMQTLFYGLKPFLQDSVPSWYGPNGLSGLSPMKVRMHHKGTPTFYGLKPVKDRMPSERRLNQALHQLVTARQDARVCVNLGSIELRRFRGGAYLVPVRTHAVQAAVAWHGEAVVHLEALGLKVEFASTRGAGLKRAALEAGRVVLGVRQGGELMRPIAGGPRRSLKNLLQEFALPPWQRDRLPLLWCDGHVVWTAGIGFDADYLAQAEEPGLIPACSIPG
jgi:tRNA(Ile)-lysidine synthase